MIPNFAGVTIFCCERSLWCFLDTLTFCKLKAVCDRHERSITGGAA